MAGHPPSGTVTFLPALLGGSDISQVLAKAQESVALARQSGMHGAIVMGLNSLALALADHEPARARAVLGESLQRCDTPGEAFRGLSATSERTRRGDSARVNSGANFVHSALRETGDVVAARLGDARFRELRAVGAAMGMEEASSYVLTNADPKGSHSIDR